MGSLPTLGARNNREVIPWPVGERVRETHTQDATGSDKNSENRRTTVDPKRSGIIGRGWSHTLGVKRLQVERWWYRVSERLRCAYNQQRRQQQETQPWPWAAFYTSEKERTPARTKTCTSTTPLSMSQQKRHFGIAARALTNTLQSGSSQTNKSLDGLPDCSTAGRNSTFFVAIVTCVLFSIGRG
jgi:hypothetical protein